jgi:hypothetical protein
MVFISTEQQQTGSDIVFPMSKKKQVPKVKTQMHVGAAILQLLSLKAQLRMESTPNHHTLCFFQAN